MVKVTKVKSHTRKTKGGKRTSVRAHNRTITKGRKEPYHIRRSIHPTAHTSGFVKANQADAENINQQFKDIEMWYDNKKPGGGYVTVRRIKAGRPEYIVEIDGTRYRVFKGKRAAKRAAGYYMRTGSKRNFGYM